MAAAVSICLMSAACQGGLSLGFAAWFWAWYLAVMFALGAASGLAAHAGIRYGQRRRDE